MLAAGLFGALALALSTVRADSLLFKANNDRLKGRLLAEEGDVLVFDTERFGVMRVPRAEVTLTREDVAAAVDGAPVPETSAPTVVTAEGPSHPPADHAAMADPSADAAQLVMASQHEPTAKRSPWRMHVAFSLELIHDASDKAEWIFELRAERKWARDELRFEPRYEYKSDNDRTTSDLLKLKTYYRHDFGRWWFAQYLPYYELNRQFSVQGVPLDYQYVRNEFGGGIRVIDRPGSILRIGVAESFYNIYLLDYPIDISLRSESVFMEAELDLPWRVSLRNRGQVLWYSDGGGQGIGNELEVTKHLNDFWWIGVRHEYRVNAPELQGDDLSKLRVFLGVDF